MPLNQPTILVKKADGSQVRLTMEEFKKYQEERGKRKEERGKSEEKKDLPMKTETEALATSAPVREIFVDEAKYVRTTDSTKLRNTKKQDVVENRKWTKNDHKSLLEEADEEVKSKPATAVLPSSRNDVFDRIVKELKFSVSESLRPRVQSLIVSRVKDIRSDEQVKEYAVRPTNRGGLGLNEAQAEELLKAIEGQLNVKQVARREIYPVKSAEGRASTGQFNRVKKLGSTKQNPLPTSPYKGEEHPVSPPLVARLAARQGEGILPAGKAGVGLITNKDFSAGKQVLHDVVAPQPASLPEKQSVGPVEELKEFSLVDFRRLALQPEAAGKILQEKFNILKKDSYLLYLSAIKSWYNSPLYRQYLSVAEKAISEGKKIMEIISPENKTDLQEAEFKVLVEVNREL